MVCSKKALEYSETRFWGKSHLPTLQAVTLQVRNTKTHYFAFKVEGQSDKWLVEGAKSCWEENYEHPHLLTPL